MADHAPDTRHQRHHSQPQENNATAPAGPAEAHPAAQQQQGTDRFFTDADIIFTYTRAQALEDGVLVDVSEVAREAGFLFPTAVTAGLWADLAAIPAGSGQDVPGRLWDVLFVGHQAVLHAKRQGSATADEPQLLYRLILPVAGADESPQALYTVKLVIGPDDEGKPVLTLMRPGED